MTDRYGCDIIENTVTVTPHQRYSLPPGSKWYNHFPALRVIGSAQNATRARTCYPAPPPQQRTAAPRRACRCAAARAPRAVPRAVPARALCTAPRTLPACRRCTPLLPATSHACRCAARATPPPLPRARAPAAADMAPRVCLPPRRAACSTRHHSLPTSLPRWLPATCHLPRRARRSLAAAACACNALAYARNITIAACRLPCAMPTARRAAPHLPLLPHTHSPSTCPHFTRLPRLRVVKHDIPQNICGTAVTPAAAVLRYLSHAAGI